MQKTNKLRLSVHLLLSFLVVFMPVASMLLLFAPRASAYIDTDEKLTKSEQHDRTILYALGLCMSATNPNKDNKSSEDLRRSPMPETFNESTFGGSVEGVAVGHEIEPEDGQIKCNNLPLERAMRFIGKDRAWFINNIWKKSGNDYVFSQEGFDLVNNEQKRLREQKRNGPNEGQGVGPKEHFRRMVVALNRCVDEPDGSGVDEVDIDGTKYQFKEGKNRDNNIAIGHDLDDDGNRQCGTIIDFFNGTSVGGFDGAKRGDLKDYLKDRELDQAASGDDLNLAEEDDECESGFSFSLTWIICPIIEFGINISKFFFESMIEPLLDEVPVGTSGGGYQAWQGFRFLANIILVGAMLFLVYGMMRGGGGR